MKTTKHSNKETSQSVSNNISIALYYLEEEAQIIGMHRLAAKIHMAAMEAEILAGELSLMQGKMTAWKGH